MKETYYFSHDYNARSDEKIIKLVSKLGWEGYGLYWAIVEKLYEAGGFLTTDYDCIAFDLRTDSERIAKVIESDLFLISNGKLHSNSVLARLRKRKGKSEQARQSALKRWNKPYSSDANALRTQSEGNAIKERKGKERKGNIYNDIDLVKKNIKNEMYSYEKIDQEGNPISKKRLTRLNGDTNKFLISIGCLWADLMKSRLDQKEEDICLKNIYYPIRACYDKEKWDKQGFLKLFDYFLNDPNIKEENKISFDLCLSQKYVAKYKMAQRLKPKTNASISAEIKL